MSLARSFEFRTFSRKDCRYFQEEPKIPRSFQFHSLPGVREMGLVVVIMTINVSLIILTAYFLEEKEGKLSVCIKSVNSNVCPQRCVQVLHVSNIGEIATYL